MTDAGPDLRGRGPEGQWPRFDCPDGALPEGSHPEAGRAGSAVERAVVRGAVLCGGRSRRMGTDKALLVGAEGRTLLERALRTVEAVGARAAIACGASERYHDHLTPERELRLDDAPAGAGPLGGLVTVLEDTPDHGWTVTLPVDMVGVSAELLQRLLEHAQRAEADLCLASGPRGLEPLLGAFGPACAPLARRLLAAGERRPIALADRRHGLKAVELRLAPDEAARALCNLNHPTDWERVALRAEVS
ncbi:MAG: molybdenum cofactor guanylyltransferase [Planctomycetota bacterium]